jgi:hypothetical protein
MTIQHSKATMWYPVPVQSDNLLSIAGTTLDAAGEKAWQVFQWPESGTVEKIGFRVGSVTVAPTANHDVRIETVGTDGLPTGTLAWTNSNAGRLCNTANQYASVTLTASSTVTMGDYAALVIEAPGANFGTIQISTFQRQSQATPYGGSSVPTATKSGLALLMHVEYASGLVYEIEGLFPWSAIGNNVFNSSSNPNERGNRFQIPFPARLKGVWVSMAASAATTFTIKVYNSSNTLVLSKSFDTDYRVGTTAGPSYFRFGSRLSLAANSTYRVMVCPDTTTGITLYDFDVAAANIMDGMGGGTAMHYTTADNPFTAFTDTTTKRAIMALALDGFDDAVGGGGGGLLTHSGMTGGLRG